VQWVASSSDDRWVQTLKNGVEVDGLPGYLGPTDSSSRARIPLTSAPIGPADGDYFECQIWQRRRQPGRRGRSEDLVALEFAAFRGGLVKLTPDEPVADSTDVAIPRGTLSSTTRMVSDPPVTRRD
jgi:hypothetical protein